MFIHRKYELDSRDAFYIFLMVMETRSKSFQAAEVMYHKLVFIHDPQDLGGKKA